MNTHALNVLELAEALDLIARGASSPLGADAVRGLRPSVDRGWIEPELQRVSEMRRLMQADTGWAMPAIPDLREPLKRLRVEGTVWDAATLGRAAVLLNASRAVARVLRTHRERLPLLAELEAGLLELPKPAEAIATAIDENGEVRDEASPDLHRFRREIRRIRSRIVDRLGDFASSLPEHYRVPDASVTIREGRYVVPVRREGRSEVGGIVHDESGTGATLFVEPPVAIEMMNRLRELEASEAREVHRILRELTAELRPYQPQLRETLEALVAIDSLYARARYAARVEGTVPALLDAGTEEYVVVNGRHPLLLARGDEVVPFDLVMDPGERTLLISGPNTGGKTVLLKAIGLISLLTQSGVVPPVASGSRLPIFRDVFADIGDEQSIEASLSTFSAHLKNLRETLEDAGWESLVLVDEIGSGTDPTEGASLARAVLVELTRRSAFTVATTHLGELKLLAGEERGVVNASLQFDAERLQPTYRLVKGLPGRSYGLAIARRLGFPEALLERAESYMPEGERDVAKLLLELEAQEQQLANERADLQLRLDRTAALQEKLETRDQELRQKEKDEERRARQQARDLLLKAREEVEEAIRQVRSAADEERLEEVSRAARRRVEEAAQRQKERAPKQQTTKRRSRERALEEGVRVRIESIGRTGTVLELRDGKSMVEAGNLRLLLPNADLTVLPPGDQDSAPKPESKPRRSSGAQLDAGGDASIEVDLRGLRVDELDLQLGRALDNAILSSLPSFRIIHGKGTGVLRERVQELLRRDPRITTFRPGERYEGGTGVTVVEFA